MRGGIIGDFYNSSVELVLLWESNCIERVWEEIVGEDSPKKEDGKLIEKTDLDGTKEFIFIYRGNIRGKAKIEKIDSKMMFKYEAYVEIASPVEISRIVGRNIDWNKI